MNIQQYIESLGVIKAYKLNIVFLFKEFYDENNGFTPTKENCQDFFAFVIRETQKYYEFNHIGWTKANDMVYAYLKVLYGNKEEDE